jgi:excisionase family DNA binding protein
MSVRHWIEVPDHRIQRHTEEHADFAKTRHLRKAHPAQAHVNAIRMVDGSVCKVDGHTRARLWDTGELEPPPLVIVDWWLCDDEAAAERLYRTFDSRHAHDTTRDDIYGAMRKHGLELTSDLLKARRFNSALRAAHTILYGYKGRVQEDAVDMMVGSFREELELLDEARPTAKYFTQNITTAALFTLAAHGREALPFWEAYAGNKGAKVGTGVDAVEALHIILRIERAKHYTRFQPKDLTRRALACFQADRERRDYRLNKNDIPTVKTVGKGVIHEMRRLALNRRGQPHLLRRSRSNSAATPESVGAFLTVPHIAEYFAVDTKTVYGWVRRGALKAHRFGRSIRISAADLEAFKKARNP